MTGSEIKILNTEIRGGREMDDTTFYTLLNLSKMLWERTRHWRKLISRNTSNSSTSSDTYATSHSLPTDFIMSIPRAKLKLIKNGVVMNEYQEVPLEQWENYQNSQGYYTIDHGNGVYYLSGTVADTYSHSFPYIKSSPTVGSGDTWIFPAEFHPYLAFDVAAMDELGIDYDDINARQGNANYARAQQVLKMAVRYDDALTRSALGV